MKRISLLIVIPILFLVVTLLSSTTYAQTHISDVYPSLGRGVRPLGMGNAFLTMKGTDENAIFYNPAAINDYHREFKYRVISPSIMTDYDIYSTIKDVLDLNSDLSGASDARKTQLFRTFINKHSGKFNSIYATVPIFSMMHKYITFSVLFDSRSTFSFRNRAFPNFEVRSRNDGGAIIGSSYALFNDDLQAGLAIKLLERIMIDRVITTNDIVAQKDLGAILGWSSWNKGFGVGADIGIKYKLRHVGPDFFYFFDPVIAVVYQDIANTRFTSNPSNTEQSVSAGVGIHPAFGEYETSLDISITEMNQRKDFLNKFHAGAELKFPKVIATKFSIRAGCNQGYPAGGFTADWDYAKLEFAFYGEEVGQYTHQKANYLLALNFSFGF